MRECEDLKDFVNELRFQVRGVVPEELKSEEKYILDMVYTMSKLCAENVSKEDNLSVLLCKCIIRMVAEMTFHKTVALLEANVPKEYHETVLHHINYHIYNYLGNFYSDPINDVVVKLVCDLVDVEYNKALDNLFEKKVIQSRVYEKAVAAGKDVYVVPVSIFDVLKSSPYVSFAYIISLPVIFISALICFLHSDMIIGTIFLVIFILLLARFLTRENDIVLKP